MFAIPTVTIVLVNLKTRREKDAVLGITEFVVTARSSLSLIRIKSRNRQVS